jgi:preprotein translocase subunit YajC
MTHALGAVALLVSAAAAPKKSTSSPFLLILVVIGAGFYFFIYRPQQKKQRAAQAQGKSFDVGDEVVTAGGIVGQVLDITDDRVILETSVGASFTVLRPYVLRKLEPAVVPEDVVGQENVEGQEEDHEPQPPSSPGTLPRDEATHAGPAPDGVHDEPDGGSTPSTPPTRPAGDAGEADGPSTSGADGPPII